MEWKAFLSNSAITLSGKKGVPMGVAKTGVTWHAIKGNYMDMDNSTQHV